MKAGPDIAMVASLVGDPARANMLTALMTGRALTASELAQEAGITPQTASSHLSKLEAGGLVEPEKQGRHRYYRLTGEDVAGVLEMLEGLAARVGHMRVRTGPKDPALRRAEMGRARHHARQPRGQFHPHRRKALCRAVSERRRLEITSYCLRRHACACRGHPRLLVQPQKTWMAGS